MDECPLCGGLIRKTTESHTIEYGEDKVPITVTVAVSNCDQCDESFLDFKGQEIRDNAVKRYLANQT